MLSIVPGRLLLLLHGGAGQVGDQAGRGGWRRLPGRLGTVLWLDPGDRGFIRTAEGRTNGSVEIENCDDDFSQSVCSDWERDSTCSSDSLQLQLTISSRESESQELVLS